MVPQLKPLKLSVKTRKWRSPVEQRFLRSTEWKRLRKIVLDRDKNKCVYCDHISDRQTVDHIDDDHNNNSLYNLAVVCWLCHSILNCGLAGLQGRLKVFISNKYSQVEIIKRVRELKSKSIIDEDIIKILGLEEDKEMGTDPVPFANMMLDGKIFEEKYIGFPVIKNKPS